MRGRRQSAKVGQWRGNVGDLVRKRCRLRLKTAIEVRIHLRIKAALSHIQNWPRFTSPSKNLTLHFPIKIDFGEILLGEVNRAQKFL